MKISIIGSVGSGKSTQAQILADHLKLPHLSTGDLLRKEIKKNSSLGKKVAKFVAAGVPAPDNVVIDLINIKTSKLKNGFVLDGSPRTLEQARKLGKILDKVIYLKVPDEENFKRLMKRKREDDTLEIVTKRLKIYKVLTKPILTYYRKSGHLLEIDGNRSIDTIASDISHHL